MNENTNKNLSDPNVQAVERMYEAFGRGDVEAVLAELAEDVEWISVSETSHPLVPWYGRYAGTAEVPRFFKEIGSNVDVTEFSVLSVAASDTDVMVGIRWAFTVRATGKSAALHMQHWWRFAGGKVIFARTAEDSAATAALFS